MSVLPGAQGTLGRVNQDDHATQPAPPVLYTGIVLYSSLDPEASAMLVADGLIAWTGPEATARIIHPDAQVVDAAGCLVTPGFVDAAAAEATLDADAVSRGIVRRLPGPTGERDGVRVIAPATETAQFLDLSTDGMPMAFGSAGDPAGADPWDWVRGATRRPPAEQRISDRAAFLAATRGGQRLAGARHPGSLQTGIEATFVVWEPWDLTVQSHARKVDSWSTDPRARTPLLPDLDLGTPRALRTVVDGRVVHDRLGLDGA
ncbi:hypothetical protein ACTXLV_13005 [Brachybacterium alimentarium]|uniref:hypothetical protein n=1 Tax=Brachybacterium alimentarium TaxID=47845 RepID=UPI0031DFE590